MGHHHKDQDGKFSIKSYWRLLGYTRKYWKRLTIGLLAGFVVGGSLLAGLLMLPGMVEAVNPSGEKQIRISASAGRVLEALESDPQWQQYEEEMMQDMEELEQYQDMEVPNESDYQQQIEDAMSELENVDIPEEYMQYIPEEYLQYFP